MKSHGRIAEYYFSLAQKCGRIELGPVAERERPAHEEKLTGMVKGVSNSKDSFMFALEQLVQNQWVVFEKKWTDKLFNRDDKEAVNTQAGAKRC